MDAPRFLIDADDPDAAKKYLRHRALQILMDGFQPLGAELLADGETRWGVRALCEDASGKTWQSIYVLASCRGRGHLLRYLRTTRVPVVTTPDCDIETYLRKKDIEFCVAGRFTEAHEYQAIQDFYGDRRAARSDVYYMNHIDEGLAVLAHLGASERARRAFCLHPLLQGDPDLLQSFPRAAQLTPDPQVLVLAMEYRNIANGYLSPAGPREASEIKLGPLGDVADMLRADKIQNFKDFILYHRHNHPRSAVLERYFRTWLLRLGVDDATFALLFERLQCQPPQDRVSLSTICSSIPR